MAGVVDVFTGAGKVNELGGFFQLRAGFKFGFDPVFDRFDVVVGGFLDRFDGLGIGFAEIFDQTQEVGTRTR